MITVRQTLFVLALGLTSCTTPKNTDAIFVEQIGAPPVITVILQDATRGVIYYNAIYQPPPTNRIEEVLNDIGFPPINRQEITACKLAVIDSIWHHHFEERKAVSGIRILASGPWNAKVAMAWPFDLRRYEASNPPGELRSGSSSIVLDPTTVATNRMFRLMAEKDWPAVFDPVYRSFVDKYLPRSYGLGSLKKKND